MTLNWMGVVAAAAAFAGIWAGHVTVRKIDWASPTVWLPTVLALMLGLALEAGALLSRSQLVSGALGILGITVLWDALEFTRQHHRVARGHAPANRANPRHARLLAAGGGATEIHWLDRAPAGRRVSPDEALRLLDRVPADKEGVP